MVMSEDIHVRKFFKIDKFDGNYHLYLIESFGRKGDNERERATFIMDFPKFAEANKTAHLLCNVPEVWHK